MSRHLVYLERTPGPPASSIATSIWYLQGPSPTRSETILPLPFVHLIINLGEPYTVVRHGSDRRDDVLSGPFVSGIQSTYLINENPPELHHVGVRLSPGGLFALTTENLTDRVVRAEDVVPGVDRLSRELSAEPPEIAMARLEEWLVSSIRPDWRPSPLADAALAMIHENPSARMADIAHTLGTTPKSLIGAVKRHCGLTPKRYADVYRFFEFVQAVPDGPPFPTWAELVARTGYYDQPHFNRCFVRFTGMTPRQYLESKRRPGSAASFLASDAEG